MTFSATAVPQNSSRPRTFVYPLLPQSTRLLPPASILPGIGSTRPSGHFQTLVECASSFPRLSFKSLKIANTSPDVRVVARPLDAGPGDLPNPGVKPESLMSPAPSRAHLHQSTFGSQWRKGCSSQEVSCLLLHPGTSLASPSMRTLARERGSRVGMGREEEDKGSIGHEDPVN